VEIDILMVSTPSSCVPKANDDFRHVVLAVDVFLSFLTLVAIKSMKKPQRFIETIVNNYTNNYHPIKHIKMDNQLIKGLSIHIWGYCHGTTSLEFDSCKSTHISSQVH